MSVERKRTGRTKASSTKARGSQDTQESSLPPRLKIPERAREGLANILSLDAETYKKLVNVLASAKPKMSIRSFINSVAASVDDRRIRPILDALIGLYVLLAHEGLDRIRVVESIQDAMEAENKSELHPKDGNWDDFKQRLQELLGFPGTLGITAKALDVFTAHEHVYCETESRILTDIRPVFTDNLSGVPTTATIVHTLKIAYHEGGAVKEVYIAMDSRDVRQLRGFLDRADAKAKSLKSLLDLAGVQYLKTEDE